MRRAKATKSLEKGNLEGLMSVKKIEEKLGKTLMKAEKEQARAYLKQRIKETDEELENVSQRLLLKQSTEDFSELKKNEKKKKLSIMKDTEKKRGMHSTNVTLDDDEDDDKEDDDNEDDDNEEDNDDEHEKEEAWSPAQSRQRSKGFKSTSDEDEESNHSSRKTRKNKVIPRADESKDSRSGQQSIPSKHVDEDKPWLWFDRIRKKQNLSKSDICQRILGINHAMPGGQQEPSTFYVSMQQVIEAVCDIDPTDSEGDPMTTRMKQLIKENVVSKKGEDGELLMDVKGFLQDVGMWVDEEEERDVLRDPLKDRKVSSNSFRLEPENASTLMKDMKTMPASTEGLATGDLVHEKGAQQTMSTEKESIQAEIDLLKQELNRLRVSKETRVDEENVLPSSIHNATMNESNLNLVETIESMRKENSQLSAQLNRLSVEQGSDGMKELKNVLQHHEANIQLSTKRIQELETMAHTLAAQVGVEPGKIGLAFQNELPQEVQKTLMESTLKEPPLVSPKFLPHQKKYTPAKKALNRNHRTFSAWEIPENAIAAFHERKLLWASRELGRSGVAQLGSWFQKMDKSNTGFLNAKLLTLAMQQSGADLTEQEMKNICSGMNMNGSHEVDYQELLDVMTCMIVHPRNAPSDKRRSFSRLLPSRDVPTKAANKDDNVDDDDASNASLLNPHLDSLHSLNSLDDILSSLRSQLTRLNTSLEDISKTLRAPFHKRDPDADGLLTRATFAAAMDEIGWVVHPQEVKTLVRRYDPRNDGFVNYTRFLKDVLNGRGKQQQQEEKHYIREGISWETSLEHDLKEKVREALSHLADVDGGWEAMLQIHRSFRQADGDKDGMLDRREFRKVLVNELELDLLGEDLHRLMNSLDVHSDGRISYAEFADFVVGFATTGPRSSSSHFSTQRNHSVAKDEEAKTKIHRYFQEEGFSRSHLLRRLQKYDSKERGLIPKKVCMDFFMKELEGAFPVSQKEFLRLMREYEEDDMVLYERFVASFFQKEKDRPMTKSTDLSEIWRTLAKALGSDKERLKHLFQRFDPERTGHVSSQELSKVLDKMESFLLSREELKKLSKAFDPEDKDRFAYLEFIQKYFAYIRSIGLNRLSETKKDDVPSTSSEDDDGTGVKAKAKKEPKRVARKRDVVVQVLREHMGEHLSRSELENVFRKVDKKKNGLISAELFKKAMESYGPYPLRALETQALFEELEAIDEKNELVMDYKLFIDKMLGLSKTSMRSTQQGTRSNPWIKLRKHFGPQTTKARLRQVFARRDVEETGQISLKEFKKVVQTYGEYPLNQEETQTISDRCDEDGLDEIQYDDFIDYLFTFKNVFTQSDESRPLVGILEKLRKHVGKDAKNPEKLKKLFSSSNSSRNHFISQLGFQKAMEQYGPYPLTSQETSALLEQLDPNEKSKDQINFKVLVQLLTSEFRGWNDRKEHEEKEKSDWDDEFKSDLDFKHVKTKLPPSKVPLAWKKLMDYLMLDCKIDWKGLKLLFEKKDGILKKGVLSLSDTTAVLEKASKVKSTLKPFPLKTSEMKSLLRAFEETEGKYRYTTFLAKIKKYTKQTAAATDSSSFAISSSVESSEEDAIASSSGSESAMAMKRNSSKKKKKNKRYEEGLREFIQACSKHIVGSSITREESSIKKLYVNFQPDARGNVTKDGFQKGLEMVLHVNLDADIMNEIFQSINTKGNMKLSIQEFTRFMRDNKVSKASKTSSTYQ